MNTLVAEIRALGHLPRRTVGLGAEYLLAGRMRQAMRQGHLSESQVAELEAMPKYDPKRERAERMTTLVAEIRASGWGRVSTDNLVHADVAGPPPATKKARTLQAVPTAASLPDAE